MLHEETTDVGTTLSVYVLQLFTWQQVVVEPSLNVGQILEQDCT